MSVDFCITIAISIFLSIIAIICLTIDDKENKE